MEWIPVSERLPDNRQRILIYAAGYAHMGRMPISGTFVAHYENEDWAQNNVFVADNGGFYIAENVSCWMPLPAPPQPDQPATAFDPSIKPTT